MSRIGSKPIQLPDGVNVTRKDNILLIAGPKGKIEQKISPNVKVEVDTAAKKIKLTCEIKIASDKAVYGTSRSLLFNAIHGVSQGYEKKIEIHGVGYNAKVQGLELTISIGFSHPVKVTIPAGITVTVPNPNMLIIQSVDKELLGQFSASIRGIKPCEVYNLKGIKYADEIIKKKAGKTFVSGAS